MNKTSRTSAGRWTSDLLCRCILLAGIAIRVLCCFHRRYWHDTYALKAGLFTHSFRELLSEPLGFEQSAPIGYVLLAKALGVISDYSLQVFLLPALVAGMLGLFLLDRTLKEMELVRARPVALAVAAFSPTLVFYSSEFKPYGIDFLVALAAILILQGFWTSHRPWKGLFVLCALAPLFSTTAFLILPVLGAGVLFVLFRNRRKDGLLPGPAVVCGAAAALCGGCAILYLLRTMPESMYSYWKEDFAPLPRCGKDLLWYLERIVRYFRGPLHFGYIPWRLFWSGCALAGLPLGLAATGMVSLRRHFLPWMTLGVLLLLGTASGLHHWPIRTGTALGGRLLLFTVPFVLLCMAAGLETVWRCVRFPLATCIAVYAVAAQILMLSRISYPGEHVEEAVDFVCDVLRDDETLFMDHYCDQVARFERPEWRNDSLRIGRLVVFDTFSLDEKWVRRSRSRTLFVLGYDRQRYLEGWFSGRTGFRIVHKWDFPPAKLYKVVSLPEEDGLKREDAEH